MRAVDTNVLARYYLHDDPAQARLAGSHGEGPQPDRSSAAPLPVEPGELGTFESMRAVVFVTEGAPKGTDRSPQEYVDPLLVLSGEVYAHITFRALYELICKALRGDRPRIVATALLPGKRIRMLFGDGTDQDVNVAADEHR